MPLELQLIRASEFVRLTAEGHFDLQQLRKRHALAVWGAERRRFGQPRAACSDPDLDDSPKRKGK